MNFFEYLNYLWSPMWFVWDLCGTVGILLLVRKWIKQNVTDTKNDVVEEICIPETAVRVRSAWNIPTAEEIKALIKTELAAVKFEVQVPPMPTPSQLSGLEGSQLKTENREAQQEFMAAMSARLNEQKAIKYLTDRRVPLPIAEMAVSRGPMALRGAMVEYLGMRPKDAKIAVLELMAASMDEVVPSVGVSGGGGGW